MALVIVFLEAFINVLAQALQVAIIVRVLLSWVPVRLPFGLGEFVWSITEPILGPIRRALSVQAGIDFSPLIALFAIQIIESILLRVLPPPL
ncbi:MAG TPA: YggT family protein [Candidatus Acidoferrales bacterium]|nr:YggT family protein [Candidatus Acidoferrales bacterium]